MRYSMLVAAAVALQVSANPLPLPRPEDVVTTPIKAPTSSAPSGCQITVSGTFGIAAVKLGSMGTESTSQGSDGQTTASNSVSQSSDGQTTTGSSAVNQGSDGQTTTGSSAVKQGTDGQTTSSSSSSSAVSQISDGQTQSASSASSNSAAPNMVACGGTGVLTVTLENGILLDSKNRTGYIAANYQYQFDNPAQAGYIYNDGFSLCSNGSLALGGSAIFYQCLSGNFSNLYDRSWAPQCEPITLQKVDLVTCP